MKTKITTGMLVILCVVLAIGITTCFGANPKVYNLKYAYITPELTPKDNNETAFAYAFKSYVEKQSKGRIRVTLYPGGQLGKFPELIQGTMNGSIDIALTNVIPLNNFYPKSMIFGIPGVFNDKNECTEILNSAWGNEFNKGIEKNLGVKVLFHYSPGLRNFTNSKRELRVPEDAKGLTIRVMESPVSIKMVEALGAKAVPIASSEMYVAMQNGVVDGQENPIPSIIQDLTYEVQKYLVLDGHFASSMMLLMNQKLYNGMPANLQKIITTGIQKGWVEGKKVIDRQEVDGVKFLQEKGMRVYIPTQQEAQRWREVVGKPTQTYVRQQLGDKIVDDLLATVKKYRNQK
jgi:tripartite ATP-independent transporter DctP family solute receptor